MARGPLRISRVAHPPTVKHSGIGTLDFALRTVRGGKRAIMEELAPLAMRFEPRLEPAIRKWQQLTPWQRRFVTLDDFATEADLSKGEFLAAIVRAAFEFTSQITDLLVACAFPSVVGACVTRAKTANGIADRQLFFEHIGALEARRALAQATEACRAAARNGAGAIDDDHLAFLRKDPLGN